MTSWVEFTDGLTQHLATLSAGMVVIIGEADEPKERRRFVQFRQLDTMIWAELPGDSWLAPDVQVGDSGGQIIESAGWQRPDTDHCDNWWYELRWPASSDSYRQLAARMVTGLRDAFGIADPATLVYEAWNERSGETELPLLGLSTKTAQATASIASSSEELAAAWRVMGHSDTITLARQLQSLVWSWRMDNLMRLLVVFDWRDPIIQSSDWVRFDNGLGPGSCDVMGNGGHAERIEIALTTLAPDDAAGRAAVHEAFSEAAAALTAAIGAPTAEIVDSIPEIRWSGEETTLLLTDLGLMVRLCLVTNTWLAHYDEVNHLQERRTS
ncbi:DUF6301 family protein [Nocardia abscessus]|uniref:DUF6301 family protein n=1 Tax=Nocardia abscessus TaxID=120957 RepID=UPI000686AE86|nr:DUF6301 family protein [Nocardia abscessus]MCC3332978.1 DUF6301 family protein [Nocardia abscessus]